MTVYYVSNKNIKYALCINLFIELHFFFLFFAGSRVTIGTDERLPLRDLCHPTYLSMPVPPSYRDI